MNSTTFRLRPRESALVRYAEDPTLWHERLILLPWGGRDEEETRGWAVCATPDRDVYTMKFFEPGRFREPPVMLDVDALPAARRLCYLAEDSEGAFGPVELKALEAEARRVRAGERRAAGLPADPVPWSEAPEGFSWVLLRDGSSVPKGSRVDGVAVEWESPSLGRVRLLGGGGREEVLPVELLPEGQVEEGSKEVAVEGDVRTLSVAFEKGGDRWRRIDSAAAEMVEVDMPDFPLEGPRSALWMVRQLHRNSLDFRMHHERWIKSSGVRGNDRSIFEHRALCRAMDLLISYDQLNVANLAGAETLIRRLVTIEEAYRGRPDAPNYEHAEYMSGVTEPADGSLVPPALKKHTAERLKADAEIAKELRKAREVQGKPK